MTEPAVRDAAPPAELTPEAFAERLYDALEPLARYDDENGWSLLILVNAIGTMFELVEELVRDTAAGPGWSLLMDVNRCPELALPWLGQFVGVRVLHGSSAEEMRARIISTDGFRRGTRAAMVGAAKATLTGPRTVVLRERDHDPADTPDYAYYLTAITYVADTPDAAATELALLSQKPAGIVLEHRVVVGQDWQAVRTNNATWQVVENTYPTWATVKLDEPS